jgi:glycosyltransferase involved in cell wall biosynthesis
MREDNINILFVTRKFPPSVGGMQKVAFDLYKSLSEISHVELISYGGPQILLPFVLIYLSVRSFFVLLFENIDVIYLQDGLLSPLGCILKIFGKPTVVTVHGLDITYQNAIYKTIIPKCMKRLDKIICISEATKNECLKRGIPEGKIEIIPNGINPDEYYSPAISKKDLKNKIRAEKDIKIDSLENKNLLLTVGRLVERKGVHWFVDNVMPGLVEEDSDIIYLVAGAGPYRNIIREYIEMHNLHRNVFLLGRVSNELLKYLYNASDIMVMPNISVEGDMEGFGIVALEASSCGTPVVASDLEGIRDAIKNERNGILVIPEDYMKFKFEIYEILSNKNLKEKMENRARKLITDTFRQDIIASHYLAKFKDY